MADSALAKATVGVGRTPRGCTTHLRNWQKPAWIDERVATAYRAAVEGRHSEREDGFYVAHTRRTKCYMHRMTQCCKIMVQCLEVT